MNLGTMVSLVEASLLLNSDTQDLSDFGDGIIASWINQAYHLLEGMATWYVCEAEDDTLTIAANTNELTMPANMARPAVLWNTTDECLVDLVDFRQAPADLVYSTATGVPRYYGRWAGTWKVIPTPTTATDFTLRYYKDLPDLSSSSDEPALPDVMHQALVAYGCYMALTSLIARKPELVANAGAAANRYAKEWDAWLLRASDGPAMLPYAAPVPLHRSPYDLGYDVEDI